MIEQFDDLQKARREFFLKKARQFAPPLQARGIYFSRSHESPFKKLSPEGRLLNRSQIQNLID
jgi:hypothetical protein